MTGAWRSRPFIRRELQAMEQERDKWRAEARRLAEHVHTLEGELDRLHPGPPTVDN